MKVRNIFAPIALILVMTISGCKEDLVDGYYVKLKSGDLIRMQLIDETRVGQGVLCHQDGYCPGMRKLPYLDRNELYDMPAVSHEDIDAIVWIGPKEIFLFGSPKLHQVTSVENIFHLVWQRNVQSVEVSFHVNGLEHSLNFHEPSEEFFGPVMCYTDMKRFDARQTDQRTREWLVGAAIEDLLVGYATLAENNFLGFGAGDRRCVKSQISGTSVVGLSVSDPGGMLYVIGFEDVIKKLSR